MKRLKTIQLSFAVLLLVLITSNYVAGEARKCRSGCKGGGSKTFKYVEGTTYKYNLDGNVDISLSSAEGQVSSTKIKATVLLSQLSQCNQLIRLQNVQVIGPDAKKYGTLTDIDKPIRINFNDGHVEDSICITEKDNQNSLNIKRAIASMFQAAIKEHYETDVFGVCPVEIVTRKEGHNLVIQKSRNLNKCGHRESINQDFMATAFNFDSDVKSTPLLNGEYVSEQRIKNGIVDYASVTENYLHVPFSVGQNGAKATAFTKIQFTGSVKEAPQDSTTAPRSIIFENPHMITTDENNVDVILNALKETKNTIDVTVGENSAKSFMNLFKILRASKKDDILTVFRQVKSGAGFKDKESVRRVFLDAVLRVGTSENIEVAIELLKNKELTPIEQKLVYLSLAFVKHATLQSISAAASLLDHETTREAYLGIGTLARRYCQQHSCENVDAVNQLVQKLINKLGSGKPKSRKEENEMINALKALTNMRILSDTAIPKVIAVAQDKKTLSRLRVAALETYSVNACTDKIRDSALGILKDVQQDSEFRIKAYLVVAKCPTGKTANALKALLDHEPSYQVGGFIISHIRSLKASVNPDKHLAKHFLGKINTNKKFPFDFRKFSFHNEHSGSIGSYGLSGSVESNVIYSQESFLPVSADFNVTAELFGATYNFLELGFRQENLGRVLEHYFGPLGILNTESAEDLVNTGKESVDKLVKHFQQRLSKSRGKRDVTKAEIDAIGKQVQIKTNDLNKDLDIDLSVKLFGSELLFLSINDQSENLSPDALIDQIFDRLDDGMNKVKNLEKSIQSNYVFLDSEFSYPTSLGFPLRVSVEGSSSVQVKVATKLDVRALFSNNPGSNPIKITFIPSANIEISGSLTVDAQVVEGGLKFASVLYTATGADLDVVTSDNGNNVDVKFSLPVQEQKLISATHEIVFNTRELGKPEHDIPIKFGQNKDFSICVDQLSPFIGVAFCADLNSPPSHSSHGVVLPFPLSGNAKFSVGIQREDLSHIHFNRKIYDEPNKLGVEYLIETIGAKNNKKVSFQLEGFMLSDTSYVKANLISPIMPLTVEGRVTYTNQEKSVSVQVDQGKQQYLAKIGFSVSGNAQKSVYKPLIQYNGPGIKGQKMPLNVEGAINVERLQKGVKYVFDNVRIIGANQKEISVQGNAGVDGQRFFTDLTVSDGQQSGSLNGNLEFQKNQVSVNGEMKNTFNPDVNFKLVYVFKYDNNHVDSSLDFVHGRDLSSKTNKLKLDNKMSFKRTKANANDFSTVNKFSYPAINVDSQFTVQVSPKKVDYDIKLHYGALKVGSQLNAKLGEKSKGDHNVNFKVYGFDNKIEILTSREVMGDKSKINNVINVNNNKFEVNGLITHHIKQDDVNIGADLVIKVPSIPDSFKLQHGYILKPTELNTFLKLNSGANSYIDFTLKGNRAGNADGNLKITLKDFVIGNGELQVAKGSGTAFVVLDFVKFHRKFKADSSFTFSEPKYDVVLTFYPNFEKDNNNKMVLSTQNEYKPNFFDSKNFIEIGGKKVEVNVKSSSEGSFNNGKQNFVGDLTLPSNHYFSIKFDHSRKVEQDIENGDMHIILEKRDHKNTPGYKLGLTGVVKDANREKGVYDLSYTVKAENGKDKDINVELGTKRQLQNGQFSLDSNLKMSGSVIPEPLELKSNVVHKGLVGTYKIETKQGHKNSLHLNGKFDIDNDDKKVLGEMNLELKTASTVLHLVKFGCSGSVVQPSNEDGQIKADGNIFIVVDDSDAKTDPIINIKLSGDASIGSNSGNLKGHAEIQKLDPISGTIVYETGNNKLNGQLTVNYKKDKTMKSDLTLVKPNEHEYEIDLKLDAPEAPGTRLEIKSKESPDGRTLKNHITLTTDTKKFVLSNELVLSEIAPAFDIKLEYPSGKSDHFAAKLNKISSQHISGDLIVSVSHNNFELKSDWDANLENIDNFVVKLNIHSPSLKIDNVHLQVINKPAKAGKRIQITATSGDQNLLSGSTTYKAREEGDKYIVEGSGTFKIREVSKQSNFKFIRQKLSSAKNGEEGAEISFNAAVGSQAIDAEFKATDKQFRIMNSYCEEKQQCAHIEIDSKTNTATVGEYNNELEVAIDLRKLGLSHEFGLKGVTVRKGFVLDHNVDIYFQEKANKYQYSLYVHPNEAGAQLSTPKRLISLEGVVQAPKVVKNKSGPIKAELAFYLDKRNQPNQKSALSASLNCNDNNKVHNCIGEIRFTNPSMGKDFLIKNTINNDYNNFVFQQDIIIDIFANANQQIVISANGHTKRVGETGYSLTGVYELKSQGMNVHLKYEEEYYFDYQKYEVRIKELLTSSIRNQKHITGLIFNVDKQQALLNLKICDKNVIDAKSQLQVQENQLIANTNIDIVGISPLQSHFELQSPGTLKYTIGSKATPNNKLSIHAAYVPNHIVEVNVDFLQGGAKSHLANAYVKLDDKNFLKSDSKITTENIKKHLLTTARDDFSRFVNEVQAVIESASKDCSSEAQSVAEVMKNNVPSLKPLHDYYHSELKKLHDEVVSDKTLKEVEDFLKSLFGAFIKSTQDVFGHISEIIEKVAVAVQEQSAKTVEIINKELIPKLTEIIQSVMKVAANIVDQVIDLVFTYIAKIALIIEEHQEEINRVLSTGAAVVQDLARALYKIGKHAQIVVSKEWNEFSQGVLKLPIAEEIKIRYEQLLGGVEIPSALINTFKEAVITLKDAMPSPELKKLVAAVGDYIEKKMKREEIDDISTIQNIVSLLISIIDKALNSVGPNRMILMPDRPISIFSTDFIRNLPKFGGVQLSFLNYIKEERLPSIPDLLYSISFNPKHWIPPYELDAVIVQGQHIFTFDGKHMTFPGDCNYLLARDAFNGNFTIAATLKKGALDGISYSDKNRIVTLKKGNSVILNNAASELPIHLPGLDVFWADSALHVVAKAGVDIVCDSELIVCKVRISGFYHGQLRGLLGNGNLEPYDDYVIPNGKIVTSESEFGNSYKMTTSCAAVKTVDHNVHHHNPSCNIIFGEDSPLRYCYPFVNPENYKTACDHGLAAGVADTENAIVRGYVTACHAKFIPIQVPAKYMKCENADQAHTIGETFSVKTPGKAADIVVVVDQIKSNEVVFKEFVQPALTQIATDLNAKGISDIDVHMITYGGELQEWPSHHTVGRKLTFKGRVPNVKFSEEHKEKKFASGCEQLDTFLELVRNTHKEINIITGKTGQHRAFYEAMRYPFRAHALKSVIAVTGKPCEEGAIIGLQKLYNLFNANAQISFNLITPFTDFAMGDAKYGKNVIGFNSHSVFSTTDSKKKLEGSSDMHSELEYDNYCADFSLKNHGNVFVVNNFLQVKAPVRKQFVQVASHNIVDQLTNTEHGLDCECKMVSLSHAQNVCKVVHSKDISQAKKSGQKG